MELPGKVVYFLVGDIVGGFGGNFCLCLLRFRGCWLSWV